MSDGVDAQQAETGRGGSGSKFGTGALVAAALVALVIGAGGGYALGHSKGQDSGKEDGIAQGKAEEAAKYEPGKAGYVKIYALGRAVGARRGDARGLAEGKRVGFEKGKKVGVSEGEQEGAVTGANAALGGLSNWEDGTLYIVTTGQGDGVPTAITQRHQMVAGNNYKLCKSNPEKLCESPEQ